MNFRRIVRPVRFAGGGPSGTALLGGHVEYRVAQPSEVCPNIKAGRARSVAVAFQHQTS